MKRSDFAIGIVLAASAVATGYFLLRAPLREKILQGERLAHYLRLPTRFLRPVADQDLNFDHLDLRVRPSNPNMLVVAACDRSLPSEVCSANAFVVDTSHNYAISPAQAGEWEWSWPAPGSDSLYYPTKAGLPSPPSEIPAPGKRAGQGNAMAYSFLGKDFYRRSEWITELHMHPSSDGRLILIVGADKRKLPSHGIFFGDALADGWYGNLTLDVFESDPGRLVAAVDVECRMTTTDCMRHIGDVGSRWFTVALTRDLSTALLFDLGPSRIEAAK